MRILDVVDAISPPAALAHPVRPPGDVWCDAGIVLRVDQMESLAKMLRLDRAETLLVLDDAAVSEGLVPGRECGLARGGCLCETMGAGKTAIMLALIACTRGEWSRDLPSGVRSWSVLGDICDYASLKQDARSLRSFGDSLLTLVDPAVIEPSVVHCFVCADASDVDVDGEPDLASVQCDFCLVWVHISCHAMGRELDPAALAADDLVFECDRCRARAAAPDPLTHHRDLSEQARQQRIDDARFVSEQGDELDEAHQAYGALAHHPFWVDPLDHSSNTRTRRPLRFRRWRSCATLIVVPASLQSHVWEQEWKKVFWNEENDTRERAPRNYMRIVHLHTVDDVRRANPYDLLDVDVVLTTREALRAFGDTEHAKPVPVVHRIHWRRLVLDEGHTAGNLLSNQTAVTLAIHADSRWIISATPNTQMRPLQATNHLVSLIRFVGCAPFTDPVWLKSFRRVFLRAYSDRRVKEESGHAVVPDDLAPTEAAHALLMAFLDELLVRHRRADINRIIHEGVDRITQYVQFKPHEQLSYNLHVVAVNVNELTSRGEEADSFTLNKGAAKESFDNLLKGCTLSAAFSHEQLLVLYFAVVDVQTRSYVRIPLTMDDRVELRCIEEFVLRVVALECSLLTQFAASLEEEGRRSVTQFNADGTASTVSEQLVRATYQWRLAEIVRRFIGAFAEMPDRTRTVLEARLAVVADTDELAKAERKAMTEEQFGRIADLCATLSGHIGIDGLLSNRCLECGTTTCSAKLDAVVETVHAAVRRGEKVLVFTSQDDFVSEDSRLAGRRRGRGGRRARRQQGVLLDAVRARLELFDINAIVLDSTPKKRDKAIAEFQTNPGEPHVCLLKTSMPSSVFGIDLHAATNIVFLEPCFNPEVEVSAIARAARAGQTSRVRATTLVVQGSVEEDLLERRAFLNMTSLELLLAAMPVPNHLVSEYQDDRHFGRDLAFLEQSLLAHQLDSEADDGDAALPDVDIPAGATCCTFVHTQRRFAHQLYVHCFDCAPFGSKWVCMNCARRCHSGHTLSLTRSSAMFCDCGSHDGCIAMDDDDGVSEVAVADDAPKVEVEDAADVSILRQRDTVVECGKVELNNKRYVRLSGNEKLPRARLTDSEPFGVFERVPEHIHHEHLSHIGARAINHANEALKESKEAKEEAEEDADEQIEKKRQRVVRFKDEAKPHHPF